MGLKEDLIQERLDKIIDMREAKEEAVKRAKVIGRVLKYRHSTIKSRGATKAEFLGTIYATKKQRGFLKALGSTRNLHMVSKREAAELIDMLKGDRAVTSEQEFMLKRFGLKPLPSLTRERADVVIDFLQSFRTKEDDAKAEQNKEKGIWYTSIVGGVLVRHDSWPECYKRVRGLFAQHKKFSSKAEEDEWLSTKRYSEEN